MLTVVLEKRLKSLEEDVLGFSWQTIGRVDNSVRSFLNEDIYLAKEIIEKTDEINKESYKIEHGCLKVLGLHQPLARDLRLGAALLRTSIELERIPFSLHSPLCHRCSRKRPYLLQAPTH